METVPVQGQSPFKIAGPKGRFPVGYGREPGTRRACVSRKFPCVKAALFFAIELIVVAGACDAFVVQVLGKPFGAVYRNGLV